MKSEVETEAVGPGTPRHSSKHFSATCKLPDITVTNLSRPEIFQVQNMLLSVQIKSQ